jgi:excisionase family DNA binding protein
VTTLDDALRAAIRDELNALFEEKIKPLLERHGPPTPAEVPVFISTADAARRIGVTVATVQSWVRENRLRGHRAGRLLRIKVDDIHEFMNRATPPEDVDIDAVARRIMSRRRRRGPLR